MLWPFETKKQQNHKMLKAEPAAAAVVAIRFNFSSRLWFLITFYLAFVFKADDLEFA